jgi:hypothetical protein
MAKTLSEDSKYAKYDADGDGIVSDEELAASEKIMELEYERVRMENEDKKEDAMRKMAWFALFGMLLYPFAVVIAVVTNHAQASEILGDMAATYFVSVAGIVAAFFGAQALAKKN